ncbi:MAG TPA: TonB family protein, partial [Steroidobacteraceae bacterium]|nr:TonB family protein [Steroidobacteraceae bacterium]
VYTDNAEFYRAICNALADHHDVRLATQLQNAVEMAEMGMCPILITDRAGTQTELQRISIAIRASEPALVTIASGSPTEGMALRKLLNTSALHSFLPKPLSAPLVRLTVESAKRHHLQLKAPREPLAASPAETPATLRTTGPRAATYQPGQIFERNFDIEDRFDFRRLFPYARIAVLVLLIAAAGGWYWQQRSQQQAQITALIDDDLSRARQAYDAGDYVAPENASALYYYRRVLNRDAKHAQALRGVDDIVERIVDQIERQLTEDKLDSAAQSIALLRELRPDHKRIDFLDNQVRKASAYRQAQRLAEQSAQVAREEAAKATAANARLIEARVSDSSLPTINNSSQRMQAVGRWLAAARQRMNQGRLVAPESDNAEYFFRLAERADPNNTAVEDGLHEIGGRLLNEAQDALNKQQLDVARKRLADAGRFGADANVITRIQSDINAAADTNTRANFLRLTLQRTRENALFEPAQDNAKYYLSQLQRLDPNGAETQQASRAIALKLLENANEATAQKQFNISIRLLDEARRLGFNGAELSEADKKLQLARNPTPATPSDTAPRTTPPRILKSVAAKYPDDAMAAGISGWVDVGFKINRSGDVYDAVAMGSSAPAPYAPKFERAAVAAISQYKFEQRTISDTQTQSMVVRVQFKAK